MVSFSTRPFQVLFQRSSLALSNIWSSYVGLIGVGAENVSLRERLVALEAENAKLIEIDSENKRLRALLKMGEEFKISGVTANVIGYDPTKLVQSLMLDKGTVDGVRKGMAVAGEGGVVGQVVAAGFKSSSVLLITDHGSGVDAVIQGSRTRGVVEGTGRDTCEFRDVCELRYVLYDDDIKVGDRVVASGMDGIYPKGLLVGVVSKVEKKSSGLFQSVQVKPTQNLRQIETVLIITAAVGE